MKAVLGQIEYDEEKWATFIDCHLQYKLLEEKII